MKQYIDLCKRVINQGVWVPNKRTGKNCLTVINADLEYDVSDGTLPVLTTKRVAWRSAIAEMLGYLRGYQSAAQFRSIGCKTWNANANENEAWLSNPYRLGTDDMGRCYGVQARYWKNFEGDITDQFTNVYADLKNGIDNRREIITFYNPGEIHMGCLAPCMHTHTFSILNGTLYLTSYQRSCDIPLGVPFNMVQTGWLLLVMARITGLQPGKVFHKMVNVHIYEDQLELLLEQIRRKPRKLPYLIMEPHIADTDFLQQDIHPKKLFKLAGYNPHPAINFPFAV